jgi:hypothetical protein
MPTASVRVYVLLARRSSLGVIFRRGPSRQVLTLLWDTSTHVVRPSQWFKGRIYERRCDLSPSGEKLIYFAAKHRAPLFTWTAVSRPPFLTALAMWPKGDAWGGGGLFRNERAIELNHRPGEMVAGAEFKIPKAITVEPCGKISGHGEDDPILSTRLLRDGWVLQTPGVVQQNSFGSRISWTFPVNQVWSKRRGCLSVEMRILGIHERDGPWCVAEHRVLDSNGGVLTDLGRSDWADWSNNGEVLFAREGCLFRIPVRGQNKLGDCCEVMDLRPLRFANVEAPPEAKRWSGRVSSLW